MDPEPSQAFDIIQPVLQYPGDSGNYWSVKSWCVPGWRREPGACVALSAAAGPCAPRRGCHPPPPHRLTPSAGRYVSLDYGTVASSEVRVPASAAQQLIFGNMSRVEGQTWYIGSTVVSTGQTTKITVSHPRLQTQPWAYNTVEVRAPRSAPRQQSPMARGLAPRTR